MFAKLCKLVFRLIGWKLIGRYPVEQQKMVIIVAPHTSAWDVPLGLLINYSQKIHGDFYVKKEMFNGILRPILKWVGAIPLDRSGNLNMVDSIVRDFNKAKRRIILLTPEGTRKKVDKFKTGFYHIAHKANVPILPVVFDFGNKKMIMKDLFYTTGDADKEIAQIENMFRGYKGKVPAYSFG